MTRALLSDADTRRDTLVDAAIKVFAGQGYHATPVTAVAAAAGISQAYAFKLFPTKEQMFVAAVERCYQRIDECFVLSAADYGLRTSGDVLEAIALGYARLIGDRDLLLLQVHAQSAANIPAIREAVRAGTAQLVRRAGELSGGSDNAVQRLLAFCQLCHLVTTLDADWANMLARGFSSFPE